MPSKHFLAAIKLCSPSWTHPSKVPDAGLVAAANPMHFTPRNDAANCSGTVLAPEARDPASLVN